MVNAAVMTSRMLLEYDGRAFSGWARQPDQRTVQAEVERALETILVEDEVPRDRRRPHRSRRARVGTGLLLRARGGRPDAPQRRPAARRRGPGVQPGAGRIRRPRRRPVADLLLPAPQPPRPVRPPRGHGRSGTRAALDRDALDACAAALPGTHDFTAFTPTETEHVRFERDVFDARWERDGDLLGFWITADTLHAPHEPHPRRDDARGRDWGGARSRTSRRCCRARRVPSQATRRRREAWRSCRSTTARARARCGRRRRRPARGRARRPWRTGG